MFMCDVLHVCWVKMCVNTCVCVAIVRGCVVVVLCVPHLH